MFADVERKVLTDEMKAFCDAVRSWRREGVEAYWNVAGGNWVYVFCLKEKAGEVRKRIVDLGRGARKLKIAGEARLI
jgi:mevalonate pyrophosphate decarboxylase